ncbi:olfactory receptor 11A1-like [Etheostoma cragini]|uniref:olfactory receptor 11A1-like n=1 Tax=Etheostoma cragini TaxID=417921 RepID=UPI00155E93FF|nr:olfactory receptor 11A1-like [Etheostoma cragini]
MKNSTQVSYFTFGAYFDIGLFKYLMFLILMCFYALIICANVLLIVVICVNRSLHEPMYLFLVSLFVNELYGSTGLFPFLLVQILSDIHTVSAPFCFLQIFCVYTYAAVQFHNLAIMSYDRYLAICYPLEYHTRMTSNKVAVLIALTWLLPFVGVCVTISLSVPLQLCGNIINTVYCDNYSIVKLACSETKVNNIYGLFHTCLLVFGPLSLILYTYMRILKVCFSGSKQTRQKAVSTCTPHLASTINFFFGSFFQILQSRFNMSSVPVMLRNVLSLYFLTCQPLFNPLMYGLQMTKIRSLCKSLIFGSNNILGLVNIFTVIFGLIILNLFSYMRILKVCFSGSRQTRQKALSTCTPHLLSLLNFSFGAFFEIIQSRFNMNYLPNMLRIFLSLYWITCQPLINPLLYGLKMSKIRIVCRHLLFGGER